LRRPWKTAQRARGPDDNTAENAGGAYLYTRVEDTWGELARIKSGNAEMYDFFGIDVAISGTTIVVGAHGEDSAAAGDADDNSAGNIGAVYVFEL
jgi:hypothetical protein